MIKKNILVSGKTVSIWITTILIFSGVLFSNPAFSKTSASDFFLVQNSQRQANLINVRLNGATDYELVDVFGKVLNNTPGVIEAKRHGSRIVPDNPGACFAVWRIRIHEPDPSRIQSEILKMIRDIRNSGGQVVVKGSIHRYTSAEVVQLSGIRAIGAAGSEIQFSAY